MKAKLRSVAGLLWSAWERVSLWQGTALAIYAMVIGGIAPAVVIWSHFATSEVAGPEALMLLALMFVSALAALMKRQMWKQEQSEGDLFSVGMARQVRQG